MFTEIIVSSHAIDRIMSDRFLKTKPKDRQRAEQMIKENVSKSFLLKLNPDGTELRAHNGKIYVCSIKFNTVTVITVLKGNKFVD